MKITVMKKKPTKLQAFFLRPLTLQQRLRVKFSVLMFRIKTRSKPDQEHSKLNDVGCNDLLLGMDNRELTDELKEAWQIINVLNMCEMDRGESYPRANLWLTRWEALGYKRPN